MPKRIDNPADAHEAAGRVLRSLAAIKQAWDLKRDFDDWDAVVKELATFARAEALLFVALSISDRAGLTPIDLEAWGDEMIAEARRARK